jgi:xylulokinase
MSEQSSLHDQILPKGVALRYLPVVRDTSAAPQAASLEQALGGPEAMANQVGATTHASLLAAQMLHVRDTNPEAWAQTSRVALASVFLCSIMIGKLSSFTEAEAAATGLYSAANEKWDEGVLKIIAGFEKEVDRVRSMLGNIERNGAKPVGRISSYFSTKYGLDAGTRVCLNVYTT